MAENTPKTNRQNSTNNRTAVLTKHIDKRDTNKTTEGDSPPCPDSHYHLSRIHMIPGQAVVIPQKLTNNSKQSLTVSPQITGTTYPERLPSQPEMEERELSSL
jgi:hypothetical protein